MSIRPETAGKETTLFLNLRSRLFALGSQVKNRGLKEVPCFALSDVLRIPKIGFLQGHVWKICYRFFRQFPQYKKSLRYETTFCLTTFYPRSVYLLYYYLLFWWADYCDAWKHLLEVPDRSLIAELFIRYIVEIDAHIDCPEGADLLEEPVLIKNDVAARRFLKELLMHIGKSGTLPEHKREICHRIWSYRNECLAVCRNRSSQSGLGSNLEEVLAKKEATVGGLFRIWASLLCTLYCDGIRSHCADSSREILASVGMAIQVIDDMLDLPVDYASDVDNIVYELLKETPEELAVAEDHLHSTSWEHLDWVWAGRNLPRTWKRAADLLNDYLGHIKKVSQKPEATSELCAMISTVGRAHKWSFY